MKLSYQFILVAALLLVAPTIGAKQKKDRGPPYQATGIKIGEVKPESVIVWARTTLNDSPNPSTNPNRRVVCVGGGGMPPPMRGRKLEQKQLVGGKPTLARGLQRGASIGHRRTQMGGMMGGGCCTEVETVVGDDILPADLPYAVPGSPGQVGVLYRKARRQMSSKIKGECQQSSSSSSSSSGSGKSRKLGKKGAGMMDKKKKHKIKHGKGHRKWKRMPWKNVYDHQDYTHQLKIHRLRPDTKYNVRVQSRLDKHSPITSEQEGSFRTAPREHDDSRIVFTAVTGTAFRDRDLETGYKIYAEMKKLDPHFFVHTGDILYYSRDATDAALARTFWQRMYGLDTNVKFHRHVPTYFMKDDHDTHFNDAWPGKDQNCDPLYYNFTFEEGQEIFLEQVPMGKRTYRTRKWGRLLQIWMVEGRDFRDPNDMMDSVNKTMWGEKQMKWFKWSVRKSNAAFKILITPTPIIGPDSNPNRNDNLSNEAWNTEGSIIRQFLAKENVLVMTGDRHWQYASQHPDLKVREYSVGPGSDEHAGQWDPDDFDEDYHHYVQVIGGFVSVTIDRDASLDCIPTATFRFHNVNGTVQFKETVEA